MLRYIIQSMLTKTSDAMFIEQVFKFFNLVKFIRKYV